MFADPLVAFLHVCGFWLQFLHCCKYFQKNLLLFRIKLEFLKIKWHIATYGKHIANSVMWDHTDLPAICQVNASPP